MSHENPESMPHLGLLRSALWGSPRIVTYNSSQRPESLPPSFETTARFLFAANVVPRRNDAFKAVLSRCDIFELSATNSEVIEMMRTLSVNGFQGITPGDAAMVIDYFEEHIDNRQLSLRLLGLSLKKLKYAREEGIDWRPLVRSQLQTLGRKNEATKRLDNHTSDLRLFKQAVQRHPNSVKDQQEWFCSQAKKSRATFYRVLARYKDEQE